VGGGFGKIGECEKIGGKSGSYLVGSTDCHPREEKAKSHRKGGMKKKREKERLQVCANIQQDCRGTKRDFKVFEVARDIG